jgi:alpha-tubulin suppressor-like RCC1 family protein
LAAHGVVADDDPAVTRRRVSTVSRWPSKQPRRIDQMNTNRPAASLLLAVLLASCANTPATPTPAGHPPSSHIPSPTATPSPIMSVNPIMPPSPGTTMPPNPTVAPGDWPMASAIAIAAGSWHTCAVMGDGGVKCWGPDAGRLGDGTTIPAGVPVSVAGLASGLKAITANADYTCALTVGGGVKCWGSNEYGQLGNGTTDDSISPVDVAGLGSGVTAVTAGASHACALMDTGGAMCWGSNEDGQLGDSTASDGTPRDSAVPVDVTQTDGISAIAAGGHHTCTVSTGGWVDCWMYRPVDNLSTIGVSAIATGLWHTCAVTSRGGVVCWDDKGIRSEVEGLTSGVSAVAAGTAFTCALTITGGVKCWGANESGQLGNGSTVDSSSPVDVAGLASGVSAITAGDSHACALMTGGGVKCWGSNDLGQLGNSSVAESSVPVVVDFAQPGPTLDASGAIVHATGPTDVLLRYDYGPDRGDLLGDHFSSGGLFAPGPEFTLYGDGTIIFRDETASTAPTKGGITRASPFAVGRLTEAQVQSLLRFALTEGGLGIALPYYDNGGEGCGGDSWTYLLRAGGIDRRVESGGCGDTFGLLAEHLRSVAASSASEVWVPGSYSGSVLKASPLIKQGVLPKVPAAGAIPWPWPDISPGAFAWHEDPELGQDGHRVMSADEAAILGLSDNGGVVKRAYLLGPDGKTVYAFSMWPRLPDETS